MAVKILAWSGGLTVEAGSLAEAMAAVAEHPLASLDTGPLRIHGARTDAGACSVVVRLARPRVAYEPVKDVVGDAVRSVVAPEAIEKMED